MARREDGNGLEGEAFFVLKMRLSLQVCVLTRMVLEAEGTDARGERMMPEQSGERE